MENDASPLPQVDISKKPVSTVFKAVILLALVLGFASTFASGFGVAKMLEPMPLPIATATPTPKNGGTTPPPEHPIQFLPGKYYFDDTIYLLAKDEPRLNLLTTVTRSQSETGYIQNTRVSYFDGTTWIRKTDSQTTPDPTIVSNILVKRWDISIDPSRVLKESVQGEIAIDSATLSFSTGTLQNEIAVRSLPGYTKFMSRGSGTVTINGSSQAVYVLYSRIYSLNARDIQFYNQPLGLTTDWVAFWDTKGNFYHVDTTHVDNPTPIYQTHQLGIMEDASGSVSRTFSITVNRDTETPPLQVTISLNSPVSTILNLKRMNEINKAPNSSYIWYTGTVEGTAKTMNGESVPGIGLFEYIHD